MRDELFDRGYQAGRAELHSGIDRLVQLVADSLALLYRVEWSAPWKKQSDCPTH